ncbi:MAG: hypothetical protein ACYCZO_13225 [Daejeonella sp.]
MMNKKEIFKKVGGIVAELHEQYEYLSQSPDNLHELELELFSANANFLSDHIAVLVKLNNSGKDADKSQSTADVPDPLIFSNQSADAEHQPELFAEDEHEEISPGNPVVEKEKGLNFEFEMKSDVKTGDLPLTADEKRVIEKEPTLKADPAPAELMHQPVPHQTTFEEEPVTKEVTILERTIAIPVEQTLQDNPAPTVNDLLSKHAPLQTVGSQFNSRQALDLKSMISLNDKLLFVRDLFNGYNLAYSEAIELLDRFDNVEAAENFLKQNYASKNNWRDKQDVADKFYDLLARRFSK